MKNLIKILAFLSIFLFSCEEKQAENETNSKNLSTLKGSVQKGPFIKGSSLTISDLDKDLNQTGKTFFTTITNDNGEFVLKNVALTSGYVEIQADGFYFNENNGKLSSERMLLGAICNLTDTTDITINLLTHLEKERVKELFAKGTKFNDAKIQAQKEVLGVFGFVSTSVNVSEKLNITHTGSQDAILLAVSVICQGSASVAELSELTADIVDDIKADGIINNIAVKNEIVKRAYMVNTGNIANNIKKHYSESNISVQLPEFDTYIDAYKKNNPNDQLLFYTYPLNGDFGQNLLTLKDSAINTDIRYSLAAIVPKNGNLKVIFNGIGDPWYYSLGSGTGWSITQYSGGSQTFTATLTEVKLDLNMLVMGTGRAAISIYENNATQPSVIKIIKWGKGISPSLNDSIIYPANGKYGLNILSLKDNDSVIINNTYSITNQTIIQSKVKSEYIFTLNSESAYVCDTMNSMVFADKLSKTLKLTMFPSSVFNAEARIKFIKTGSITITGFGNYKRRIIIRNPY